MKIVTFCGKCSTLPRVWEYIKHDLLLIDMTYYDKLPEKIPIKYEVFQTQIPYDPSKEMTNRRKRIAILMRRLNEIVPQNENILFLDSDVYVKDPSKIPDYPIPYTLMIIAKIKPESYPSRYLLSTNIYVPHLFRQKLNQLLNEYLLNYTFEPVDIWLNQKLQTQKIHIGGTCHIIDNMELCV